MSNVSGPYKPTTAVDAGGALGAWTNAGLVTVPDNLTASGDISTGGKHTNVLLATNFSGASLHIPAYATIQGISVTFLRYGTNAATDTIQLYKAGVAAGSVKVGTDTWPLSEDSVTYGGATDLWGTTWTPSDVNATNFGVGIAAYNTHSGGSAFIDNITVTIYWQTTPSDVPKSYQYKSFAHDGTYLGDLPVISEFAYSQDINTSGSQITLTCGLSIDTAAQSATQSLTDEGGAILTDESGSNLLTEGANAMVGLGTASNTLIKNGNRVTVWEFSHYYPDGHVVFRGFIEKWEATFGGSGDNESVDVLVYSLGSDMDNYLLLGSPFTYTLDQSNTTFNISSNFYNSMSSGGGYAYCGQSFTVGTGVTNLGAISLWMSGTATVTITVYSTFTSTTILASSTVNVATSGFQEVQFSFANHIPVTAGNSYFFSVTIADSQSILIAYNNSSSYSGGTMYTAIFTGTSGGAFGPVADDLYFKTFSSSGQTTATFTSMDPSTGMLDQFMSDYNSRGGVVTHSTATVDATGLSLTYTLTTETIYGGVNRMLSLAPDGFYFYVGVDYPTLYFKQSNSVADITLTRGKEIEKLSIGASIEQVINSVYFSGGIPTGSTNLYKYYSDVTSIAQYGQKLSRISDNRVTLSTTADAIGNSKVAELKDEMYATSVTVIDKQMDTSTIRPGMIIGFAGFGSFVDSLLMQIVRVAYTPEETTLTLGVLPKRLHTELDQITRGLIAEQTLANPTTPS